MFFAFFGHDQVDKAKEDVCWKLQRSVHPVFNTDPWYIEAHRKRVNSAEHRDNPPAIVLDPSSDTLAAALAGKICYREAVSGTEKVTTDQIRKIHPWHDVFMAESYLMLGGGGYKGMRELIRNAKRTRRGTWREGLAWSHRIGKWVDANTGLPVRERGDVRVAQGTGDDPMQRGGSHMAIGAGDDPVLGGR